MKYVRTLKIVILTPAERAALLKLTLIKVLNKFGILETISIESIILEMLTIDRTLNSKTMTHSVSFFSKTLRKISLQNPLLS